MTEEIVALLTQQSKDIGEIKGSLQLLVGNGQPGLVKEMRDDIDSLKDSRAHARGYIAGLTGALALLEFVYHYLMHKLGAK